MATKYAGQNALNKLMQLVKTALNNKADKTHATTSAAGLMPAADKAKLDGIEAGATKTTVDAALDATSKNPVQNKAVKAALDGKLSTLGGEISGYLEVGQTVSAKGSVSVGRTSSDTGIHFEKAASNAGRISHGVADVDDTVPLARLKVASPTEDDDAATKAYVDGRAAGSGAVRYDASQTLTYEQKFQARKNIGALSSELPVTTGPVSLCPANVTDNNDAVHLTTTKYSGDDFTLTLDCGPENALVRVNGIRTPTDADTNAAATVEYVKSKVASGGVTVDTAMSSTSTNPVQNKVVKSYVDTKVSGLQTADQVQAAISSAITGVYTPKGSIAFASLPTAAAGNKGWVYNVTNAFTPTAAFVEGAGHSYGAGTNVVCVDAGSGSYKWDVLAGTVDLTELTADEVQTLWNSI